LSENGAVLLLGYALTVGGGGVLWWSACVFRGFVLFVFVLDHCYLLSRAKDQAVSLFSFACVASVDGEVPHPIPIVTINVFEDWSEVRAERKIAGWLDKQGELLFIDCSTVTHRFLVHP